MTLSAEDLRQRLVRNLGAVPLERQHRAPLYDTLTASLSQGTAATKLGASIDVLAPGMRGCPYHHHLAQEELFIVLEGTGTLRVAGQMLPIGAGDLVFIPPGPEYPHQIINTGTAPLKYLSLSTQERPEVCVYPDSGKTGAFHHGVRLMGRPEQSLDYWDGEP
jgi:uncharacterized cupin superfamily protein